MVCVTSICGSAISAACMASRKGGMFDDDTYETLKNDMAHSKDGVYDNLPGGEALVHCGRDLPGGQVGTSDEGSS